ncbi:MAG: DsbA family protein [Alphaproteobacteria bacterium]|nr:DsbA family protein [Alphaproteobacteria bacterium]
MTRTSFGLTRRDLVFGLTAGIAAISLPTAGVRADLPSNDALMGEMVLGKNDAPITIIAYESMTCPHCATFHRDTLPQLKSEYIDTGKARLVFRDFPLDQLSLRAHMMARCGGPDRYFGMIEVIFRTQNDWARDGDPVQALAGIGRMSGITKKDFDACMGNKELFDFIVRRIKEARDKYGIQSTPTFIVNEDTAIIGAKSFEEFDEVLKPLIP